MKKYLTAFVVMMSLFIFACSTGEKSGENGPTGVAWEDLSLQDTIAKAADQSKLIVIDFFSPG
jgi:hypothetical protein